MNKRIIAVVKGAPVLNDCTITDAEEISLTQTAEINGSDAVGTILEFTSPSFRGIFEKIPLIISKGQGNFETLSTFLSERNLNSKKYSFFFSLNVKLSRGNSDYLWALCFSPPLRSLPEVPGTFLGLAGLCLINNKVPLHKISAIKHLDGLISIS